MMTKQEFLKLLNEELQSWCSNRDRMQRSWWLALEEYAKARFNEAYEADMRSKR